jgi:hypothetical protein
MPTVNKLKALQATVDETIDPRRCERIEEMISWHLGSQSDANTYMDNVKQEELLGIQQNNSGAKFMR